MKKSHIPVLVLSIAFFGVILFTSSACKPTPPCEAVESCIDCHSKANVLPGVFKQYLESEHFKSGVTCVDCHRAEQDDPDAFDHHEDWISIIVSPNDCGRCHEKAVTEFNASMHSKSRALVTTIDGDCTGDYCLENCLGDYCLKNIIGSQFLDKAAKYAAGVNACLRCHGTKIEIENGRPTWDTWPNSGIGRENPDGSRGNCAACHERHEFSVAQARQPQSCAICHNSGGGDPQSEAYNTSRHGTTYYAQVDQMNLSSDKWVVGKDYFAAPTCATCHLSATTGMFATHNINERLDWSALLQLDTLAVKEKCGLPNVLQENPYPQPEPNLAHRDNMKEVCSACHSDAFVDNFLRQYEEQVQLNMTKWITPGKELFVLATDVLQAAEGEGYEFFTHPIDYVWFGMCNTDAKTAYVGAAMMSPGMVNTGDGALFTSWYTSFMPAIKNIIDTHPGVQGTEALEEHYNAIRSDPVYYGPWDE